MMGQENPGKERAGNDVNYSSGERLSCTAQNQAGILILRIRNISAISAWIVRVLLFPS
jgi:hypothetical protein